MKTNVGSLLRIIGGLLLCLVIVPPAGLLMLLALPSRVTRIRISNALGTLLGQGLLWIAGCRVTVRGTEHRAGPAIFVMNHTSSYDAFTSVWLTPSGTVGVAKKEIIYYPFYGQAWVLAGQLSLDRKNPERAKASLNRAGELIARHRLSVCILPEGTRSRDGRLGPFKKGFLHLALQTRLPIVPMVVVGAHRAWDKGTLLLRSVPVEVTFLPPIDTTAWKRETLDEHIDQVRQAFIEALPPEQRPLSEAAREAA